LAKAKTDITLLPELTLIHAEVADALDQIEDGTVQLVLTSPPYNVGKIYERGSSMSLEEYLLWLAPIAEQICAKVADRGSILLAVR
jgi:adenine-specific DNA-methyltransferase